MSDQLFAKLAPNMATCWHTAALVLGFKRSDVERFRSDYNNVTERAIAMLSQWQQKNAKNATRQKLMKAFQDVGRDDLVTEVKQFR